MKLRAGQCNSCPDLFYFEIKRGRPPVRCYSCRGLPNPYENLSHLDLPSAQFGFESESNSTSLKEELPSGPSLLPVGGIKAGKSLHRSSSMRAMQSFPKPPQPLTGAALAEHLDNLLKETGKHISQHPN